MTKTSIAPQRARAFRIQNGRCIYCDLPMCPSEKDRLRFARQHRISPGLTALLKCTAEHLVAKQDGGDDSPGNIAAACLHCNRHRHKGRAADAPSAADYRAHVRRRISLGRWHPAVGKLASGNEARA